VQKEPTTYVTPETPKAKAAPGTHYGETENCDMWQKIFPGDIEGLTAKGTCASLAKTWAISNATLAKWNP
jgi:hypothetical protein